MDQIQLFFGWLTTDIISLISAGCHEPHVDLRAVALREALREGHILEWLINFFTFKENTDLTSSLSPAKIKGFNFTNLFLVKCHTPSINVSCWISRHNYNAEPLVTDKAAGRLHWVLLYIPLIKRINNYNTVEFPSAERLRIKGEIYVCLICPLISLKFLPLLICFIARLRHACWVKNLISSHRIHTQCGTFQFVAKCRKLIFFYISCSKWGLCVCVFQRSKSNGAETQTHFHWSSTNTACEEMESCFATFLLHSNWLPGCYTAAWRLCSLTACSHRVDIRRSVSSLLCSGEKNNKGSQLKTGGPHTVAF